MIILFIDTSTSFLNIAIFKNDILIEKKSIHSIEHSKYIMSEIEKIFKKNNILPADVKKIMVTIGPGSFTGIRIGVTIAKIYAWACKINIIPISTLKAFALSSNNKAYYLPLIDARRGYVYASLFDENYNEILKEQYIKIDDLKEKILKFENINYISDEEITGVKTELINLNLENIFNYYKNKSGISPHRIIPNYLKKTEAEEKIGDIYD